MLGNERRLVLQKEGISEITFDLDAFKVNLFESNQDLRFCSSDLENKPASLLVVPLGKALSGIPPSWCGRQTAGNS